MSQVDLLLRLQQLDDDIRNGKKRLTKVINLQKASSKLDGVRKIAQDLAEQLKSWRAKQSALNLELSSLNDKAKRQETRLYSGTVTNPKELEDIQNELESLGRRRSVLEDELIEAMIMVEESEQEEADARHDLESAETNWAQDQAALLAEQNELITQINELTLQRKQHLTLVSSESMAAYNNALRRAGILAVVELRKGRCRGCQVTVPANLVKLAEDGNLIACDNCSRVLCPV